jgi:dTDP-4-dehydrorhamnose reductase
MKIAIIGGSSFIGSNFVKSFSKKNYEIKYSYFKNTPLFKNGFQLDITNKETTKEFFKNNKSDIVIISTALTNVDLCETNPNLAEAINVKGTQNIIDACKNSNIKIIYISTSAVFDGKKSEYNEEDKPNPTSVYGATKLKGEKIVIESNNPYLILRTDQPYGWKERWQHTNSVIRVIENLEKDQSFNEISNWYNSPTFVPDFVNATKSLIKNELGGIFHLVGSDFISRYEWSQKVAEIFNLNKKLIKEIDSNDLKLPVKRVNVHLSNKKLDDMIGHKMIGIREGLQIMLNEQCQKSV